MSLGFVHHFTKPSRRPAPARGNLVHVVTWFTWVCRLRILSCTLGKSYFKSITARSFTFKNPISFPYVTKLQEQTQWRFFSGLVRFQMSYINTFLLVIFFNVCVGEAVGRCIFIYLVCVSVCVNGCRYMKMYEPLNLELTVWLN